MVRGGIYHEHLSFNNSGTSAGYITLEPYGSEHPILDGTGVPGNDTGYGNNMVQMINISYVKLIGFEIDHDNGIAVQADASGVYVSGSGTNVQILNNTIHDITGSIAKGVGGSGIQVYGTSLTTPYSNVMISGNTIYLCQPGDSQTETLTLNGNITNFQITNNVVHDNNNIGIDMIGGEAGIFGMPSGTLGLPVARNGICSHNTVYNIHANYSGGYAGGIYVDGGKNITISDNVSDQNDMGIEVGAENQGYVASGVVVEDNLFHNNNQGGIVFGGYDSSRGRVENCAFINNTVYTCDKGNTGQGALQISYASGNVVANNIFVASANNVLINSPYANSNTNNTLDNNLYYTTGGASNARFSWNGQSYSTFSAYKKATGEDAHSPFGAPLFVNAGLRNFHIQSKSPAVNAGSSKTGWFDSTDFDGRTRDTHPDIGAYEYAPIAGHAHLAKTRPVKPMTAWYAMPSSQFLNSISTSRKVLVPTLRALCVTGTTG